jgi:anti-sigma regulatory factor (Ser/Thr protein kinase)
MTETDRVELRLPHASRAGAEARRAIRERLSGRLDPGRIDEIVLITDELVTNAVQHAQAEREGGIGLRLEIQRDRVRVVVTDGSPRFEWSTRASTELAGGFGLVLVDRLSDRWGLSLDGKKAVWFEVDFAPA